MVPAPQDWPCSSGGRSEIGLRHRWPHKPLMSGPGCLFHLPWRSLMTLGLGQMGVTGSMAALAWLWSVPYLKTGFSLSASTATLLSSCMMVFFAVGGVVFGRWSDRIQERRRPLMLGTTGVIVMLALLSTGVLREQLMITTICLWLMGLCAGSMVLSFAAAKDLAKGQHTGAVVAFMNLCVMTGSIGLPPIWIGLRRPMARQRHRWCSALSN